MTRLKAERAAQKKREDWWRACIEAGRLRNPFQAIIDERESFKKMITGSEKPRTSFYHRRPQVSFATWDRYWEMRFGAMKKNGIKP